MIIKHIIAFIVSVTVAIIIGLIIATIFNIDGSTRGLTPVILVIISMYAGAVTFMSIVAGKLTLQ